MPTYLRPGVYVEEIAPRDPLYLGTRVLPDDRSTEAGPRPLKRWSAEHGVAGFLGVSSTSPERKATRYNNWNEFEREFFFDPSGGRYLWHAVHGFFANGGQACYVVDVNKGDPAKVRPADFLGDHEQRSGLAGLEAIEEISVVAAPDLMGLPHLDVESVRAVQLGLITHAEVTGRVAILDTPRGLSARQVREWRETMGYNSAFAALYYPWIRVLDGPATPSSGLVPPSGHLAGVHARSDVDRHVANEPIQGALWLELDLLLKEQEVLHPMGINALLAQPGRGALVWGARTLSSDPTWRYLRTRRLMNFIARNIRAGTNWVIFEKSHDEKLWYRIREELEDLLSILWRTGALGGDEPEDAYTVKCDRENNPPEVVDAKTIVADCAVALHEGGAGQLDFRVTYFLG
jgi:hypothetical protein